MTQAKMRAGKSGRYKKIPDHRVPLVVDRFNVLLIQAISEAQAGKDFPTLSRLKMMAGIDVTNATANPWLKTISKSYQQARYEAEGEGPWQNQFRPKKQRTGRAEIEKLISQILAEHGALNSYRLSYYVMRARGVNRRDEALVIRTLKRMAIAGQLRNVGAGRYSLIQGENAHDNC